MVPRPAGPITSLLENPQLATTFVTKLACPADRSKYLDLTWEALLEESSLGVIRHSLERQCFIDRMRLAMRQLGSTADELRIRSERLEEAEEEVMYWRRAYRHMEGQRDRAAAEVTAAKEDLEEERSRFQELEETASALRANEDLLRAECASAESRLWQAEASAAQLKISRDTIFAAAESKDRRLRRLKDESSRREKELLERATASEEKEAALRQEITALKEGNAAALSQARRQRLEDLVQEPECQELLLQHVVSCCKRSFESCKKKVARKFPGLDLDDISPDGEDL